MRSFQPKLREKPISSSTFSAVWRVGKAGEETSQSGFSFTVASGWQMRYNWTRSLGGHLDAVAAAFDRAKRLPKGEFPCAAGIRNAARPVAIDGSRALIEQWCHREAITAATPEIE